MKNQTRKMLKFAILGMALAFVLSSCARRTAVRVNIGHPASAKVVVVKKGHAHTARCGHYKYRGKWYIVKGHAHGPRCGHRFVGGFWIYKK
ncbi:MAG: hypothetical protein ACE5I1_05495 [bacterium]